MRRLVLPLVFGLGGAAVLVALGVWQVSRLGEKEAYFARVEAQIAAPPGALPETPDQELHRFQPVAVTGRYLPGEILVLASRKGQGPGYRVIAPFETEDGRAILVDRGFLPEAARTTPRPGGAARVVGNLDWPQETDSFTPPPDAETGLRFARDVPTLAAALGTEPVLLVLREAPQAGLPMTPLPVDAAGIPNDHLQYAVTWFALAVVWLGMTAHFLRRPRRRYR